jgi:transcriptional regulator with XRE-family HTH domain
MKKLTKNGYINRELILRLRTQKNLSQRDAAKEIGVAFGTIQSAEQFGRMNMGTLQKFADFYGLPKSAFLIEP